ncbi:hypothetical protein D778_01396 [Xanthomarina gelatinilytica]|uniref:Uncharacterized protein n=1 Tax=Xanthomarina gelatinilytica TaxID=1137281 RepID=M7MG91_9FLAO|nr:hypothetical protein D778_01396 [Xanthomarina gelatinilytica]
MSNKSDSLNVKHKQFDWRKFFFGLICGLVLGNILKYLFA